MPTYHGQDGWSIEEENLLACWVGNQYVQKHIDEEDIPGMVDALVSNCGVGLTEDAIGRLDGSSYEDLLSLMLACSISLQRMNEQTKTQGAPDEEMQKIVETAIELRSIMLGIPQEQAKHEMMNDDLVFDASVNAAKLALGYGREDDELILKYEDRWNPDRNVVWFAKDDSRCYYFSHGQWVCDVYEEVYTYPEMHFGNLEPQYFPMKGQRK